MGLNEFDIPTVWSSLQAAQVGQALWVCIQISLTKFYITAFLLLLFVNWLDEMNDSTIICDASTS